MGFIIQPARIPNDIDEVRKLFKEYQDWLQVDLWFQGFDEELASLPGKYSEPNGTILLVWEGQGIAGGVALRPLENKICEMKRLFVRQQWRGKGLGEKLVKEIIRFAVTAGYLKMRLDTETRLEKAIELYQKFKFVTIEKYNDNPLENIIYMERDLKL